MKVAYADPPYLGMSKKRYRHLHPEAADYDELEAHRGLVERLCADYPDGWALSLYPQNLRDILPLCPREARVFSWVKTYLNYWHQKNNIAFAWEPVILCGGRPRPTGLTTMRDWFSCPVDLNAGYAGAKPALFCRWLFEILGMQADDEFHDLFPGGGGVGRAWEEWKANRTLPFDE